jgi:hypothetical protein
LNYFHFLTQENIGFKLSEIMVGSGIWKKPIPDPGSRGQKGTGSRIRIRNTALEVLVSGIIIRMVAQKQRLALIFISKREN